MAHRFFDHLIFSSKALREMPDAVAYTSSVEDGKLIVVIRCQKSRWVQYRLRMDKAEAPGYFIMAGAFALGNAINWTTMSPKERFAGLAFVLLMLLVGTLRARWWIWRHPVEERIIFGNGTVTIEHEALGIVRRKRWPTAGANIRLQIDYVGDSMKEPAYLCMDAGLRMQTFAHNLSEPDARKLLGEIRAFLGNADSDEEPNGQRDD